MKASHIYTKIKNLMVTKPSDNKKYTLYFLL